MPNDITGYLDALVASSFLKLRSHFEPKTTCEPDASDHS